MGWFDDFVEDAGQGLMSGAAGFVGGLLTGNPVGGFIAGFARGYIGSALTPDEENSKARPGITLNTKSAGQYRQVIYGETKVGGVVVYEDTYSNAAGDYLYRIIAVADHEVDSFQEIYLDDFKLTIDSSGSVTSAQRIDEAGNSVDSAVTTYNGKVHIKTVTGGHAAGDDPISNWSIFSDATSWTNSHDLLGIAHIAVRLKYQDDIYENGVPTISAKVRGKKVYDPRDATTAWSDNPALIVRDFLLDDTFGLGEASSNVFSGDSSSTSPEASFAVAADVCDESVTTTVDGSASAAHSRYTCNGTFTTDTAPVDILEQLMSSCAGGLWYSQGKWRMRAGKYIAPTLTLDEDDLRAPLNVSTRHSTRDNFNKVRGTYRGPETNYQFTDYPAVTDSAFVTVDGGVEQTMEMALQFTDTSREAQRLANIALERQRSQITVTGQFGLAAFNLQPTDIVKLTNTRFGWTDKLFEVASWSLSIEDLDPRVNLILREITSTTYDAVSDVGGFELDNTVLGGPVGEATIVADFGISSAKLGFQSVTETKIGSSAVTTAKLEDSAVSTVKIQDSAVTTRSFTTASGVNWGSSQVDVVNAAINATSGNAIQVIWTVVVEQDDVSGTGRVNYRLFRKKGTGSFEEVADYLNIVHDLRAVEAAVYGETPNYTGTITYKITAENSGGGSSRSQEASMTVLELKK